ncbi:MAG: glucokinase [Gammaproteobacteria bacterium]
MILSGDIGGTNTSIGLFRMEKGALKEKYSGTFETRDYSGLQTLIKDFLDKTRGHPREIAIACFGVAGPVTKNSVKPTNLPSWEAITGDEVAQKTGLSRVMLLNDLVAMAYGISALGEEDIATLHAGEEEPGGNRVLLAAGTGLGMALLPEGWETSLPIWSEGGHMDFAPRDDKEIDLLKFLQQRKFLKDTSGTHVSVERVVSGAGLKNIYDYLVQRNFATKDPAVPHEIKCSDAPQVISKAALEGRSALCTEALRMFVAAYGAAAGNLALVSTARGGVYLGGGIAPHVFKKRTHIDDAFEAAFLDKGRFRSFLEKVPVRVILNTQTVTLGAAHYAAQLIDF